MLRSDEVDEKERARDKGVRRAGSMDSTTRAGGLAGEGGGGGGGALARVFLALLGFAFLTIVCFPRPLGSTGAYEWTLGLLAT